MNGEDVLGNKIKVVFSPHREYNITDSYPSTSFHEDMSSENFSMQLNKSNQGIYSSPSWKPTWKRTSESFRQGSLRQRLESGAPEASNKYGLASTSAASNSSTPNDTSRDGSPSLVVSNDFLKFYFYNYPAILRCCEFFKAMYNRYETVSLNCYVNLIEVPQHPFHVIPAISS